MIRYSIIIPHHNIPDLLMRCLCSIPEREDVQVVVVDDNSTDADQYKKIYPELNRNNVQFILTQEGKGAGYARNKGLEVAIGKWLVFADADDFFEDNFIQLLDEYYDSENEIIYFNTKCCMSEDISIPGPARRSKSFMFDKYRKTPDEKLFRFGYTEPWGKMIRRDLVEKNKIRFDETMVSNDYLFSVQTGYYAKTIGIDDKIFYVYTIRQGSLASEDKEVHLDKLCARLDAYINVQSFMQSVGYHSSPALTSHILVPLFKNYNWIYRQYLHKLKSRNLPVVELLQDTMVHYFVKLKGKNRIYGDVYSINWKR